MCEFAVFINENGTSKRIARSIVRVDMMDGCSTLLDSGGKVIKVDGAYMVMVDTRDNEIRLKKRDKG
jgi:hypothetical protein